MSSQDCTIDGKLAGNVRFNNDGSGTVMSVEFNIFMTILLASSTNYMKSQNQEIKEITHLANTFPYSKIFNVEWFRELMQTQSKEIIKAMSHSINVMASDEKFISVLVFSISDVKNVLESV
jgi:hypothetical protein